jgi:multiple sugar transport system substrate-binding protein
VTPIELRGITWDHVRGLGGVRAAAEAYRQERPDVRVTWTPRSLQAFADQPLEELARDFDLLVIDHPAVGHAAATGSLVPLDLHLANGLADDQARSSVGRSAESYRWDGHRWALAIDAAAQVAAYRPDFMEQAGVPVPTSWDEAIEGADELRRHGRWSAIPASPVDAACAFLAACCALGEEPLAGGHDRVASPDVGRAVLDLLASFVSRSHPASLGWNPPRMLEHMSRESDVAYCPLAFGYSNYARAAFRPHRISFGPGPSGPDRVPRGTLGGAGLAVSAAGRWLDEALRLAEFVADEGTQRGAYFDGGGQPAHRGAWSDPRVNEASGGFFRDTLAAVDAAYLRPQYDGFIGFQAEAGKILQAFLREPGDQDATLALLDSAYRTSLAPAGR